MLTLTLAAVVLLLVYLRGISKFNYWSVRRIKHDKPIFLFGTNLKGFLVLESVSGTAARIYTRYLNEKVVGFYRGFRPELHIRDPAIIKRILVTDFAHFHERGILRYQKQVEPLMRNLFFADGDLWKLLRQRMTPAFTSGKLKAMFPLVVERAERLQARTLQAAVSDSSLDAKDLMSRYAIDFIGACGFGVDSDALNNEECRFRKLGNEIFNVGFKEVLTAILKELWPETFKNIKYLGRIEKNIFKFVTEILKQRNYKPCGRNDFVDLLLECKEKGSIVGASIERANNDGTPEQASLVMDDTLIAAQMFVFFLAGFETSSSATSFTLHQLAYNQEVQRKVQEEIDTILAKYGKLNYEAVKDMNYLEWTLKEGLRMFPSVGLLMRQCAHKYSISEVNLIIEKGMSVIISVQALQNDPNYFPNPEEFRPEHFNPNEFRLKDKIVFLPFGEGPRACIGARLGLMQSMAGLVAVLSQFTVHPAPQSVRHPAVDKRSGPLQRFRHELPLIFRRRRET